MFLVSSTMAFSTISSALGPLYIQLGSNVFARSALLTLSSPVATPVASRIIFALSVVEKFLSNIFCAAAAPLKSVPITTFAKVAGCS